MATVALWPLAIVPSAHPTVPVDCEQVPCDGVAESNVTPAGRVSFTCTPVALDGPALAAVREYVSSCPALTGSGESAFVSERSAAGVTLVDALAELSAGLSSKMSEETLALFVIEPSACGRTFTATVALAPEVTVPSAHVTVPLASEQLPCKGVADPKVAPAGRLSVTCTPVVSDGPALWAVSVYVTGCPASTGSGDAVLVSDRSAAGFTVVSALAVLSDRSGSKVAEL